MAPGIQSLCEPTLAVLHIGSEAWEALTLEIAHVSFDQEARRQRQLFRPMVTILTHIALKYSESQQASTIWRPRAGNLFVNQPGYIRGYGKSTGRSLTNVSAQLGKNGWRRDGESSSYSMLNFISALPEGQAHPRA